MQGIWSPDKYQSPVFPSESASIGFEIASPGLPHDGIIDELRVSGSQRSAAWIKATYNSLWDSLLTYGDEETEAVTGANILFIFADF